MQAGVELAGVAGADGDAEAIALAVEALAAVGLPRPTIDLGHLGLAREVLSALALPDAALDDARRCIAKRDGAGLAVVLRARAVREPRSSSRACCPSCRGRRRCSTTPARRRPTAASSARWPSSPPSSRPSSGAQARCAPACRPGRGAWLRLLHRRSLPGIRARRAGRGAAGRPLRRAARRATGARARRSASRSTSTPSPARWSRPIRRRGPRRSVRTRNRGAYGARNDQMAVVIVVGAQWGDEGKGKIVDLLTEQARRRRPLGGRRQRRPHAGRRRQEVRHAPDPVGRVARRRHLRAGRRHGHRSDGAGEEMRTLPGAGIPRAPSGSGGRRARAPDAAVPPRDRSAARRTPREHHRHHAQGDRPDLREQGRAHRRAGRRSAPPGAFPRPARAPDRAPDAAADGAGRRRPRRGRRSPRTISRSRTSFAPTSPMRRASCTTRSSAATT